MFTGFILNSGNRGCGKDGSGSSATGHTRVSSEPSVADLWRRQSRTRKDRYGPTGRNVPVCLILSPPSSEKRIVICRYLRKILDAPNQTTPVDSRRYSALGSGLKIRVSAVRFCPWPPFQISALIETDTHVKCPIFIGHSSRASLFSIRTRTK